MFTGLVEATGRVVNLTLKGEQAALDLEIPFVKELELGESVAVNGCCLTVAALPKGGPVRFDVLKQTLDLTSLGDLQAESVVNLERALAVGDRLGGHFVQGHVDDVGEVRDLSARGQDYRLEVALPAKIHEGTLAQGSITIDGISLTVAELTDDSAVMWITPHTRAVTNLQDLRVGSRVNLEADLLGKWVRKFTT